MTGRRFHHPPTRVKRDRTTEARIIDLFDASGAERLETLHLRLDIIRLDIEVDAARVGDALDGHPGLTRAILQADVIARLGARSAAQGSTPEETCRIQIGVLAIDVDR